MLESTPTLRTAVRAAAPIALEVANALPIGHYLHEFELRGVIGAGGFGIVYRAFDRSLEREVAIKEYMPSALAGRSGKQQVSLLSASHSETFALGLSSFVNEAKMLARFDHPSLVKVHRFWEDNGTAYMVMPLYRGVTLRQLRQTSDACPGQAWLLRLLDPLLGALEVMHREGVFHRDIAPDNILVADGAPPVLLDFGAARRVISDRSQTLTAILKPSYAPLEQYAESVGMRQGPWTDFYALGATLHLLITGKPPMPATTRALSDDQPRLAGSGAGGVSDLLLQVCDWMLAPRPQERPQHVAELRAALAGRLPVPQRARVASEQSWQTTVAQGASERGTATLNASELPIPRARAARRMRARTVWGAAGAMVGMAVVGAWWAVTEGAPIGESYASPAAAANRAVSSLATPAAVNTAGASNQPLVLPANDAQAAATAPTAAAVGQEPVAAAHDEVSPPRAAAPAPRVRQGVPRASVRPAVLHEPAAAATKTQPPEASLIQAPAQPTDSAPAPVSVAVPTRNPREHCAGRHLIALHRCMVRECEKPEYQAHRECQRVRDIELRARNFNN